MADGFAQDASAKIPPPVSRTGGPCVSNNRAGEGGYGVVADTVAESGEKSAPESSACTA